jgi:hypothetical protein
MSEIADSIPFDPLENALEADEDVLISSVREVAETLSIGFAALDELDDEAVEERLRLLRRSIQVFRDLLDRLERVHDVAVAAHRVRGADEAERAAARAELLDALERLDQFI